MLSLERLEANILWEISLKLCEGCPCASCECEECMYSPSSEGCIQNGEYQAIEAALTRCMNNIKKVI